MPWRTREMQKYLHDVKEAITTLQANMVKSDLEVVQTEVAAGADLEFEVDVTDSKSAVIELVESEATFDGTVAFKGSIDGVSFYDMEVQELADITVGADNGNIKLTGAGETGLYRANVAGLKEIQLHVTATGSTGEIDIHVRKE